MAQAEFIMILIVDRDNQLGNRLFAAGHMIATAIEFDHTLLNLGLVEYASLFPSTANDLYCRFPARKSNRNIIPIGRREKLQRIASRLVDSVEVGRLQMLRRRIFAILRSGHDTTEAKSQDQVNNLVVNLDTPRGEALFSRYPFVIPRGPLVRAESYFQKHQEAIRQYFQPTEQCQMAVDSILSGARRMADVVVGVHIRRQDYASFVGGRYFFSMNQYREFTLRLSEQLPGQKVVFLICSDSNQYRQAFRATRFLHGTGKIDEDLYALAACDYIIGPPSTFSGWASFYGKTPLYHIRDINSTPELDNFQSLAG